MKASNLFIKALENEGVEYIFTVPGEETLDIIESIRQSKLIKLIVLRHEQGAGFMAATYGRLTSKPGVCLVTLGPGATNLMTSIAYAQLGGMPMIVISGQKPIKMHKQGRFQVIDVISMMKPVTKLSTQIVNGHNIPSLVRQAFHLAEEERPGVVHIEFPEDISKESSDINIFAVKKVRRPNADEEAMREAAGMISKATHPLLLIGAGANRKRASTALKKFIERTGIPFFTTQMGKGVVDERSELFLGTAAISEGDFVHRAIDQADLIINAGHDIVEKPPFFMSKESAEVIHINFESAQIDDTYFPQLEVVGDIGFSITYITKLLKSHKKWNSKSFQKIKADFTKHLKSHIDDTTFPICMPRLVHEIQKLIPPKGIITLDNGLYKIWFARNYYSKEPTSLLLDNALATMGAGLPSAMAAKIVYPERSVIAICGDGGFLMNSHELEPAVRLKLDLIILILCDNAYGMIKWEQKNLGFKNYGMDFNNPDYQKYAEAYGAKGYSISSIKELKSTISKCLYDKGVHIIEIPIDYSNTTQILKQNK